MRTRYFRRGSSPAAFLKATPITTPFIQPHATAHIAAQCPLMLTSRPARERLFITRKHITSATNSRFSMASGRIRMKLRRQRRLLSFKMVYRRPAASVASRRVARQSPRTSS